MFHSHAQKLAVAMTLAAGGASGIALHAQAGNSVPSGPSPILMTVHEIPQPGAEAAHARVEAEYAATLEAGKGSQYYLGMGSLTGIPQTVFLSGYASFAEIADVHDEDEATMGEKMASLGEQHSETLAGSDTAIWRLRPELGNPDKENLARMRFMQLIHIHVKLGHGAEFADLINKMRDSWMKADPDFHYSIYQQSFGNSMDDSYLVVIPLKSLAELDRHHTKMADYRKTMGDDAQKRMLAFESTSYNSVDSNLFAFTPSMSRLPASWIKNDADFWKPKPVADVPASKPAKTK